MMNDILLQQVRVLNPVSDTDKIADVLISGGLIQAIEPQINEVPKGSIIKDCQGLILGPGLVDLYSHTGEPGFEERETLESLMQAASAGGFTRLTLLPNMVPPLDNPSSLAFMQRQWLQITRHWPQKNPYSPPILQFWGAFTQGIQGQQMTELVELATAGVVGFADGMPLQSWALLQRLLEYLKPLDKPIALCCWEPQLTHDGVMREGYQSLRFGLPGIPAIAETAALAAILEIVAMVDIPVHLMGISTARSVELIQAAKNRRLPITASTPWTHLLLNSNAIGGDWRLGTGNSDVGKNGVETHDISQPFIPYNPNLRLEPPLGNPQDQFALIQGIKSGILDAIAIDHRPYTYEEKTVAFADAPPGTIGLELALPLLWQTFVTTGQWSALELWRVLSTQPALCLQQTPGKIAVGEAAEVTLFNPQLTWTAEKQTLKSRANNTPWLGKSLTGKVVPLV